MCGIVGFIGDNALMNVMEGLRTLEYRGYDSAGVAYMDFNTNEMKVVKREGRLINIHHTISEVDRSWPEIAIGHTRWATHGKPSELNAHPHVSGNIAVVHNGIIENYVELSEQIKSRGKKIVSDTDTEVIAHLIDLASGSSLLDKVRRAVMDLRGSYAIAVLSEDHQGEIVVARNGSPLVVGLATSDWPGTIVSSDVQGLVEHTDEAYILRDDEFAVLTKEGIRFFDPVKEIQKGTITIDWKPESISIGEFDTFMRKEIQEQPAAVTNTVIKNDWNKVSEFIQSLSCTDTLFLACGTSFNASKIGVIFLEDLGLIYSRARLASEVCYSTRVKPGTLVIAVSQSGETADTLNAVRYAKEAGATVLAIVNVVGSTLTREADFVVYTAAGPEISVASTKAFTSQLAVLYMLGGIFHGINSNDGGKMLDKVRSELENIADDMRSVLSQEPGIKDIASTISDTSVLFLGKGMHTPVAYEGALKLKEISYLHAEGLPAGEIKHGPLALVETGTPVIALVLKGATYNKMISSIKEVQARGARVIAIASEGDKKIANITEEVIYIPNSSETLSPILSVLPLQLLSYHVAKSLGRDIDKPRNLAKSVTVE